MKKYISYSTAINQAIKSEMKRDKKIILMGLGVDDPKGVFGTTLNIHKLLRKQVFDMPTAENGFTGIGLGLAISGFKPIIVHQRVEFSLLSVEQIINQIAKWSYMSDGKVNTPIVIRLIIGKGWGQGPQHSQSLEALFTHIPGLKVVSPSFANDAKELMIESIRDPDPIIFFEHRWLHHTTSIIKKNRANSKIGKASVIKKGKDITLISFSYSLVECLKCIEDLNKLKINTEIIDLKTLRPLDKKTIINSVKKTKNVLIVDNGMLNNGISSEISAIINESLNEKIVVKRIGVKDQPIPSSPAIAKFCYPRKKNIIETILKILKYKNKIILKEDKTIGSDQPDKKFTGPF